MENRIVELVMAGAITMLWWFFRERLSGMQKQIDETSRQIQKVQLNYLGRFDDLKENLNSGHEGIRDAIADLREDLAKNYMSKSDCAANIQVRHK